MLRAWIASLGLIGFVGCAPKDEIRVYEAESDPPYNGVRKPVALLAAIVPQADRTSWVFKVSGPESAIAEAREATLEFLQSVEMPKSKDNKKAAGEDEGPAIRWKLPGGWTEADGGGEFRFKTISIPTKKDPLELTVSRLPPGGGRILPNVNRWRGQIGRNPISEKELPLITKKLTVAGAEATLVEVKGFTVEAPEEREPFQYTLPIGWQKTKKALFAALTFKVEKGERRATISVSAAGGDLDGNLNRWRKQMQLAPLDKTALLKESQALKIAGQDAIYVDYTAPGKEADRDRLLGIVVHLNGDQTFIKMSGPADLVEQEKAPFERFATSLTPRLQDE
jgi:hypothetical protein